MNKDVLTNQNFLGQIGHQKTSVVSSTHTHTESGAENSLFQFCLTITKPFSPFYFEEMKVLSFSRTVSQLIMRAHKPKVEYKLALQ